MLLPVATLSNLPCPQVDCMHIEEQCFEQLQAVTGCKIVLSHVISTAVQCMHVCMQLFFSINLCNLQEDMLQYASQQSCESKQSTAIWFSPAFKSG